jgi:APA family basic amino acid/polyamine antiporter
MFLCAKSASAATAALGLSGYVINAFGAETVSGRTPLALVFVAVLTLVILTGIRRTNLLNIAIVSVTLFSLAFFVLAGLPSAVRGAPANLANFFAGVGGGSSGSGVLSSLLHAVALVFVAYTGYGRIATMGEEVRDPRRTIPRAIIATLGVSMVVYVAVGMVGVASVGAGDFYAAAAQKTAALEIVARRFGIPAAAWVMAVGALTAMSGVLLNLILGLSRVLLAMGRRKDMPSAAARLNKSGTTPYVAVLVVGAVISGLVLIGNVRTTWSFSAFSVLIYYAITNFCALRMPSEERLYPRWIATAGLICCLALAFFVEPAVWITGLAIIALGIVWHLTARKLSFLRTP